MTHPPQIGDTVIVNGGVAARVVSAGLDVACVAVERLNDFNQLAWELYWLGLEEIEPAPPAS